MSESRDKEDLFGNKYTEHVDDAKNKIGESREHEGIFGDKYTEHVDDAKNKIGESREGEGIFGDKYTEHVDDAKNKIGESREDEGIFGDKYTEHYDNEGNKIGESREREGIFGDKYTEHTGNTPHQQSSDDIDLPEGSGLWDNIGEKAAAIGFVIGALLGLFEAFSEATGFTGYLWRIVGYGFGLAIILGLMVRMLPWALAAGAVLLLLKACGVGG